MDDFRIDFDKNLLLKNEDVNEIVEKEKDSSEGFEFKFDALDKQISNMDNSVADIIEKRNEINQEIYNLGLEKKTLENEKFEFDKRMKRDYEKINNMKIDFEQEKNRMFNDIQDAREQFAKEKREFDKYRKEEMQKIEDSRKKLENNYRQFEKIVNKFNNKIDSYNN